MNVLKKRLEARKARKRQKAYDRLHGVGKVSVPPKRRSSSAWFDEDDAGEMLGDILLALPRLIVWVISKISD